MTKEEIKEKYAILQSREDLLNSEIGDLRIELNNLTQSRRVSELTKEELRKETEIRRRLDEIDGELDNIYDEYEKLDNESEKLEKEECESEKQAKRSKRGKVVAGVAGVLAVATLAFAIGRCNKDTKCNSKNINPDKSISLTTEIPEETDEVVITTSTPVVTATPVVTPEPTAVPVLVDVTNVEDVEMAADRILSEDINPIVESENDSVYTGLVTKENIEDIIRVANGELPLNSEYDDYTIGETANMMNDIFANRGLGNKLYPVHFSKLYEDGSKEAEYVETYDEIYNKIAEYRAEENVDGFIEQVGVLGSKLYNEWHLAGLYGGWNPYLFSDEEHYFLLQAATSRFSNYVREYLEANDLTVCIETCYNPETQEYKLVEVRDIFEALYMGTSKNGEISVWRSGEVINVFGETYQDLKHMLDTKAQENVKVLK